MSIQRTLNTRHRYETDYHDADEVVTYNMCGCTRRNHIFYPPCRWPNESEAHLKKRQEETLDRWEFQHCYHGWDEEPIEDLLARGEPPIRNLLERATPSTPKKTPRGFFSSNRFRHDLESYLARRELSIHPYFRAYAPYQ